MTFQGGAAALALAPQNLADRLARLAAAVLIADPDGARALVRAWDLPVSPAMDADALRAAGLSDRAGEAMDGLVAEFMNDEAAAINRAGLDAQLDFLHGHGVPIEAVLDRLGPAAGAGSEWGAESGERGEIERSGDFHPTPHSPHATPNGTRVCRGSALRRLGLDRAVERKLLDAIPLRSPRIGNLCRETARVLDECGLTPAEVTAVRRALGRFGWALAGEEPDTAAGAGPDVV